MKRILKWSALGALVVSLSSCGLPGALMRSAGSVATAAGGLLGPAMAAGAL